VQTAQIHLIFNVSQPFTAKLSKLVMYKFKINYSKDVSMNFANIYLPLGMLLTSYFCDYSVVIISENTSGGVFH